jgi:hypothetical protein
MRKTAVKRLLNCLVVCAFSLLLVGCGASEGTGHKEDTTPGGKSNALPEDASPEDMDAMMKQSEEKAAGGGN